MARRTAAALLAAALLLAACDAVDAPAPITAPQAPDATTTRDDPSIDCSEDWLGEDDTVDLVTAHVVVDGRLGPVCLGVEDDVLLAAWNLFALLVPADDRADVVVFSGFRDVSGSDEVTQAFVLPYDDNGEQFQVSVNVREPLGRSDLLLTLAHEFSHVLTGRPDQLDRFAKRLSCPTWFNGEGCLAPDSMLWAWIQQFWGELVDEVDVFDEAFAADGEDRCGRHEHFFGPYAASTPEEDLAEAFSAWVLLVPLTSGAQQEKYRFFDDRPELAVYRERAQAAGFGPLPNTFEGCGT